MPAACSRLLKSKPTTLSRIMDAMIWLEEGPVEVLARWVVRVFWGVGGGSMDGNWKGLLNCIPEWVCLGTYVRVAIC